MKIKRHIIRQNWMLSSETMRVFKALQGDFPEDNPQALFVGGCVRNLLLDKSVEDIDIATVLSPDKAMKALEEADIKVFPTGIDHGTVTAVIGDNVYEVTTLRQDTQTDGRRAVVEYTDSWVEDARRRDFTMNTLLMDLKGNIFDPLDSGISDIDARKVRFVGDAEQRIEEDYLRILRFFRFSALYGAGEFDAEGLIACKAAAENIDKLSRERITQEFFKIIASDKPVDVIKVMFGNGVLKDFEFPDLDLEFFEHFCNFQSRYRLSSLSSRLLVFASLNLENIKKMQEFILFPKVFLKDMRFISGSLNLNDLSSGQAVRESVYRFGRAITAQALMVELVQDRVMNSYAPKALDIVQNWDIPDMPVDGHDLMKAGIEQGSELGTALEAIENFWIDQNFKADKQACLAEIKAPSA